MKICVLNGSPKGANSVTLQWILYLSERYPEHDWRILHVGQRIRAYEKDMTPARAAIEAADLVLFAYPVYTFLAPSQLQRFIECVKEAGVSFAGKYASQITTSKHFFDTTAHRYIEENCHDLGAHVVHGLSADMDDLLQAQGRRDVDRFFRYLLFCMESHVHEPDATVARRAVPMCPKAPEAEPKRDTYDTVIVADLRADDGALRDLIENFEAAYPYRTRLVNLAEYPFAGGCLGCFHCAGDGRCVYKDGFDTFLRAQIQRADAIVYAFRIRDHSMGARFKCYDDRQFCNGHRTVTEGMPMAYIACGDYGAEENLRTVVEARAEVGHNFLAGVGFDIASLDTTAKRLSYALENAYVQPRNFYGVGGMKIFRDLIWTMRGLMKADHQFYKKHGVYDFPQKKRAQMLKMCVLGALVRNRRVKARMGGKITEGMLAPYKKAIDRARRENQ